MRLSLSPLLLLTLAFAACGTDPSLRAQRGEDTRSEEDSSLDTGTGDATEGSGDAADGSGSDVIEDGSGDAADGSGSGDTTVDTDPADTTADTTADTDPPDTTIPPGCSDGVVQSGEACDDGNSLSGDGCSAACAVRPAGVPPPMLPRPLASATEKARPSFVESLPPASMMRRRYEATCACEAAEASSAAVRPPASAAYTSAPKRESAVTHGRCPKAAA